MKVFKFGGASINSAERFIHSAAIIKSFESEKLLVIVSAMGKTTNALEEVVEAFTSGHQQKAIELFGIIKQQHLETIRALNLSNTEICIQTLQSLFTETEWLLHDQPVQSTDYYYDQIVCCGELFSSAIMNCVLQDKGAKSNWTDVRDLMKTDNHFRNATILWDQSSKKINECIIPALENHDIVVTQGFIGSTDENESTTLGREGSDYSAAVFANILQAESVTIWKDVDAVMSADPKKYPDAAILESLSYTEVIEMAYYGAQVIHPKTIKPLQNKNIPLLVKSFINPALKGTVIGHKSQQPLPPIIVNKDKQVLIEFTSKDFSFVEGQTMNELVGLFGQLRISPNISQQTAISLLCGFDDHPEKIEALSLAASALFEVTVQKNLTLLTVRHYDENIIEKLTGQSDVLMKQQTPRTIQVLFRKIS